MRQFTTCYDGAYAVKFQQLLQAAGIAAEITTEYVNAYMGASLFIIWVPDDADLAAARRAGASLIAPDTGDPQLQPTRVRLPGGPTQCRSCGYDLRGQIHDGKCPECSHSYTLVFEGRCPACNAQVPSDFDICWNCGAELPSPPA
jgi:ribosomal protein L40E